MFTANRERFKFRPYGLEGGETGREGHLYLIRQGEREALGSKIDNLPPVKGDIIRLETSGGGGYGAVEERMRPAMEHDRLCRYA